MFSNKRIFLLKLTLLLSAIFTAGRLSASEIDPRLRVRIAEGFNSPPSVLLLMQLNDAFAGMSEAPPVWQTLSADDDKSREELEKASVIGAYDMLITGDGAYVKKLEQLGVLSFLRPVYSEKLILVGPADMLGGMAGLDVKKIANKIYAENILFFSQIGGSWGDAPEEALWRASGVTKPFENKNYVESDRDDLSLLIQAEDEGGFLLMGEASFAQYMVMVRDEPVLVKFADTGEERTTYVALIANAGYRKERTAAAQSYVEWLSGEAGRSAIDKFELGGIAPFRAVN